MHRLNKLYALKEEKSIMKKSMTFSTGYVMVTAGRVERNNMGGKEWIYAATEAVLALVYPPRCPVCDEIVAFEDRGMVHPECRKKLFYITGAVCMKCGQPVDNARVEFCFDCGKKHHHYRQGKGVFLYKGDIKQTMYRFKYSNKREYAAFFAGIATEQYTEWMQRIGAEVIVPVPMYRRKQKLRGYNQAEVFARELSRRTGIPYRMDLVSRTRDTKPQKNLNDTERKNNLKNAFHVSQDIVKYRYILLVDDIYTTGSTVDAIAQAILQTGVIDIYSLSICIGKGI